MHTRPLGVRIRLPRLSGYGKDMLTVIERNYLAIAGDLFIRWRLNTKAKLTWRPSINANMLILGFDRALRLMPFGLS